MEEKQFAVLGLGVFGSTVATTLSEYGYEVIAVDKDVTCVERIADEVTKAVVCDVTDIEALKELGIGDIDVGIVAIGNHLEESILATMTLKELNVPYVVAKGKNKQFKAILEKIGANRVVRAEKEMGVRVAKSLIRKNIVDLIEIDDNHAIVEIKVMSSWVGKTIEFINVRKTYGMNILGVKHNGEDKLSLNVDSTYCIQEGDRFLVIGERDKIEGLDYMFK